MNAPWVRLSAVIIAKNEEASLTDCIQSVSFCDEIVVVDSGSSDRTLDVARKLGARVYERAFDDFAAQNFFNFAICSSDWRIIFLRGFAVRLAKIFFGNFCRKIGQMLSGLTIPTRSATSGLL